MFHILTVLLLHSLVVGKALLFRIFPHNQQPIDRRSAGGLCLVQWYNIIGNTMITSDKIGNTLNRILTRWHRKPGKKKVFSSSPEFGLIL